MKDEFSFYNIWTNYYKRTYQKFNKEISKAFMQAEALQSFPCNSSFLIFASLFLYQLFTLLLTSFVYYYVILLIPRNINGIRLRAYWAPRLKVKGRERYLRAFQKKNSVFTVYTYATHEFNFLLFFAKSILTIYMSCIHAACLVHYIT